MTSLKQSVLQVLTESPIESLVEGVSRKHFQMVADTLKEIPDIKKRTELASHHAEIFKKQNPRFDHHRFFAAAGLQYK